jgi:hypothetical protein
MVFNRPGGLSGLQTIGGRQAEILLVSRNRKDRPPPSMSISLNKPRLDNLAGDIWKSAERLRGKFKAYEYQSVILPISMGLCLAQRK